MSSNNGVSQRDRTRGGRPPVSEETRQLIRDGFKEGKTREELAVEHGVSYNTVRNILKGDQAA
jgi:hypothetical protein